MKNLTGIEVEPSSTYEESYDKFLKRHFDDVGEKHLDNKAEYKQVANFKKAPKNYKKSAKYEAEPKEYEDDEGGSSSSAEDDEGGEEGDDDSDYESTPVKPKRNNDDDDDGWYYDSRKDYERIKALSEKQVAELVKKPGNCKHYEKDGMMCATCKDPETGDNSESCAYSSVPTDKKVAYLSNKSYRTPPKSETDGETESQEEAAVNPPPSGPKPLKHLSESEDAEYGAYKLAGENDDVADYDEPKFAQIKAEPQTTTEANDFEIITQQEFQPRDVKDAYSDFKTKDWSKCNKLMKGDMTCYYCKDHKGAVQEECMFISASNPKKYKVARSETSTWDNSKKPTATTKKPITPTRRPYTQEPASTTAKFEAIRAGPNRPAMSEKQEKFARMRIGRPLAPTRGTVKPTAEPLVTPATSINPTSYDDFVRRSDRKTIKRMAHFRKKKNHFDDDFFQPAESRVISFESHVNHDAK